MNDQTYSTSISHETNSLSTSLHLTALDSLRGLAALYVCLGHTVHQANLDGTQIPKLIRFLLRTLDFGHYAVVLFIVLSGFCLMLPVIRNGGEFRGDFKTFFFRRARRILPPYYVALLFSILLATTWISQPENELWKSSLPVTAQNITTHLLLIHDLFKTDIFKINSPFWSIAVEWRIYLFFPFLIIFWKKWGGWKVTLTVLGIAYCLFSVLSLTPFFNSEPPGPSLHFFFLFSVGMLTAEIVFSDTEWNRQLRKNIPWTLLSAILYILAIPAYGIKQIHGIGWILSDLIAGLAVMSLLIAILSFKNHPLNSLLTWQPLVKLGCFSYSIYLLHMPLMQVFIQYISHPLHLSPLIEMTFIIMVGVPLIISISYLFFLLFEKPFLSQRAKKNL